ncbi:homeodomain-interacting protein kinase 1-like [Acanthochromis polyacanthus]|uniref:homeodomain-interacting protein kinase 1-like n=1 Tax=Acanthochromis polyacanthus TaxID=80966 RepID=UPI002233FB9D|nr:homeodomain-interacting protein kinase 1-like [Acanthochromis polyacanthus]
MAKDLGIKKGSRLGNCHVVEDILGEGSYGIVAKCRNMETTKIEAIKVNKSDEGVLEVAMDEIAILKRLRCLNPDTCNIIRCNGFFFDKENICIRFELLDLSLQDYLQEKNPTGLTARELRPILHQLATALSHLHSSGIIHADLKWENVMVVNRHEQPVKVKLIDFGVARLVSAVNQGDWMGTLHYSAPEMLLGVPFNESVDIWALGLLMVELATGYQLYPGETEYDVLRFIFEAQGQPPDNVLDRGCYTPDFFFAQEFGSSRWRFKTPGEYQHGFCASERRSMKLNALDDIKKYMVQDPGYEEDQEILVSLIKRMLSLDADRRITAQEVLEHQFFAPSLHQSSTDFNVRSPVPPLSAASWEEGIDFKHQIPASWQSAASWDEREDFNYQSPASWQSAASWEKYTDFNHQSPDPYLCATSWEEHGDVINQSLAPIQSASSWQQCVDLNDQSPSPCQTAGEVCIEVPDDTSTENIGWFSQTPAPCQTAGEVCIKVPDETSTENIGWFRRIIRRIVRFFHTNIC